MSRRLDAAILSYAQVAIRIITTLIFTPILVRALGQEGYGLFSIVGAVAAYLYLIDFGMNDAVLRFFVRLESDRESRRRFLARMLGLYAALGGLVVVATVGLHALTPKLFGGSLTSPQIVLLQQMILAAGAGAAVMVAFNPLGALISAAERFIFLRGLEIVTAIGSTVLTIILLWRGYGALMVVMVMSGALVFQVIARLVYVILALRVPVGWALPPAAELKPVAIYAAPIFVSVIVEQIYWKLDSLIIGALAGAAPVAIYAIGTTFNKHLMSFGTAVSRIMTPEIIRQADAGAGPDVLTDLLARVSRLQALFLMLVLSGLCLFGDRFIDLWLGPEYALSYVIMLIVLIPYSLELVGNARNIVLQVKGLYWHRSLLVLTIALLNIPLTVVLIRHYGIVGAAVSTALGLLVGYASVAVLLQVRAGLNMRRYFAELARGIGPALLAAFGGGAVIDQLVAPGWIGLIVCATLYAALYGALMLTIGMNKYERSLVLRIWRRLLPARATETGA